MILIIEALRIAWSCRNSILITAEVHAALDCHSLHFECHSNAQLKLKA